MNLKSFNFLIFFASIFFSASSYFYNGEMMKKETILYGTAVLITTNLAVKVMSLVYRGILIRLIGAEGLGLTELMMPLFSFLLVVASLGVPLAISNFISAERDNKRIITILKTGTLLLTFNSVVVSAVILLLLPFLKELVFTDDRIVLGFLALIPSVVVISVFSALRGYFQGSQRSSIIGKSQVVEQLARILTGCAIVIWLLWHGYDIILVLVGLSAATFLAETCGGIYLLIRYTKDRPRPKGSFEKRMAKRMLRTGTPITLSRLVASLTFTCQAVLVPKALIAGGASLSDAATFFGLFSGVALTILHLPSVVTGALTTPLIPAIVAASSTHNRPLVHSRIRKSLCFTTFTAIPILALLYYFGAEICDILFAAPEAGPMLSLLCLGGIFIYLQHPIIAVLQGLNRFRRIFIHYCIADFSYLIGLYLLGRSAYFSINGFILLFILNDVLMFFLNYAYMKKITGARIPVIQTYLMPLLSSIGGFIVMMPAEKWFFAAGISEIINLLLSAAVFLIVYCAVMIISGALPFSSVLNLLARKKRR